MMFAPNDSPVHPAFRRWLLLVAGMIFVMVVVGGLTRLTESGLSMTEWRPIFGWLPPLADESWRRLFDLYKQTPQFRKIFPDMTLGGFKAIFWFEYLHRLLGRMIGLVFFAGFVYLLVRRRIPRRLMPQLTTLLVLGGLQGALGWYMVTSGLVDRPSVSHFRLAAHLSLAILLYVWIVWILSGFSVRRNSESVAASLVLPATTYLSIAVTIVTGAFVAGLDAGKIYNTFPLMGGTFVPTDYLRPDHDLNDFMSSPVVAQFNHRFLAIVTVVLV
ncbi:MAG: COX15/CtaA family protein, partial [Rhodospirillaceae bacterium]|nr:COX15/CtaA family protein [Rhodospirillaceae bacterium]